MSEKGYPELNVERTATANISLNIMITTGPIDSTIVGLLLCDRLFIPVPCNSYASGGYAENTSQYVGAFHEEARAGSIRVPA